MLWDETEKCLVTCDLKLQAYSRETTKICVSLFRSLSIPLVMPLFLEFSPKASFAGREKRKTIEKEKKREEEVYPVEKIYSHCRFYVKWNNQ